MQKEWREIANKLVPLEISRIIYKYLFSDTLREIGYYQNLIKIQDKITERVTNLMIKLGIVYYYNGECYLILTRDRTICGGFRKAYSSYDNIDAKSFLLHLLNHIRSAEDDDEDDDEDENEDYHTARDLYVLFEKYHQEIMIIDKELAHMKTAEITPSKIPGCSGQHAKTGVLRQQCIYCFRTIIKIPTSFSNERCLCYRCDKVLDRKMMYIGPLN